MEPVNMMQLSTISPLFTDDVLRKAVQKAYLKKTGCKNIPQVVSHTVGYASSKGDGYIGIVYRITVQLQNVTTNISLVAKGLPANLTRRKLLKCTDFFAKEVLFYTKIVPIFHDLEQKARNDNFIESFLAIPDCYYAVADGHNDFIVMEDLQDSGYNMLDRSSGLSCAQIEAMFKMLAKFHAFSLALEKRDLINTIVEPILRDDQRIWIEKYIIRISEIFCKAVETELKGTKYLEKFKKFIDPDMLFNNMKYLIEKNEYNAVISHGDAWIANFMFNDVNKVKAIDFQVVRACSPIHDVSTVLFACTTTSERTQMGGVNGILDIYMNELVETVAKLGCHDVIGVTQSTLRQLWRDLGAFGLASAMELVTLSVAEADDVPDANELPEEIDMIRLEDMVEGLEIKGEQHKKRIADLIRLAVDDGLLK